LKHFIKKKKANKKGKCLPFTLAASVWRANTEECEIESQAIDPSSHPTTTTFSDTNIAQVTLQSKAKDFSGSLVDPVQAKNKYKQKKKK
jgi:hypothetical protein